MRSNVSRMAGFTSSHSTICAAILFQAAFIFQDVFIYSCCNPFPGCSRICFWSCVDWRFKGSCIVAIGTHCRTRIILPFMWAFGCLLVCLPHCMRARVSHIPKLYFPHSKKGRPSPRAQASAATQVNGFFADTIIEVDDVVRTCSRDCRSSPR